MNATGETYGGLVSALLELAEVGCLLDKIQDLGGEGLVGLKNHQYLAIAVQRVAHTWGQAAEVSLDMVLAWKVAVRKVYGSVGRVHCYARPDEGSLRCSPVPNVCVK